MLCLDSDGRKVWLCNIVLLILAIGMSFTTYILIPNDALIPTSPVTIHPMIKLTPLNRELTQYLGEDVTCNVCSTFQSQY